MGQPNSVSFLRVTTWPKPKQLHQKINITHPTSAWSTPPIASSGSRTSTFAVPPLLSCCLAITVLLLQSPLLPLQVLFYFFSLYFLFVQCHMPSLHSSLSSFILYIYETFNHLFFSTPNGNRTRQFKNIQDKNRNLGHLSYILLLF